MLIIWKSFDGWRRFKHFGWSFPEIQVVNEIRNQSKILIFEKLIFGKKSKLKNLMYRILKATYFFCPEY
jgi:hypothetical protein